MSVKKIKLLQKHYKKKRKLLNDFFFLGGGGRVVVKLLIFKLILYQWFRSSIKTVTTEFRQRYDFASSVLGLKI